MISQDVTENAREIVACEKFLTEAWYKDGRHEILDKQSLW